MRQVFPNAGLRGQAVQTPGFSIAPGTFGRGRLSTSGDGGLASGPDSEGYSTRTLRSEAPSERGDGGLGTGRGADPVLRLGGPGRGRAGLLPLRHRGPPRRQNRREVARPGRCPRGPLGPARRHRSGSRSPVARYHADGLAPTGGSRKQAVDRSPAGTCQSSTR